MAPRIAVRIATVDGRYQPICDTRGCNVSPDGRPWVGSAHVVKAAAKDEARWHRQWHRGQQPVNTPEIPE